MPENAMFAFFLSLYFSFYFIFSQQLYHLHTVCAFEIFILFNKEKKMEEMRREKNLENNPSTVNKSI